MRPIEAERREPAPEQGSYGQRRKHVPAQVLEAEDQAGEAEAGEEDAGPVDRRDRLFLHVRHEGAHQEHARQRDGQVQEENVAPGHEGHDGAAQHGPHDGSEQSRHGHHAHRADQLVLGCRPQQHQAADRPHHGAGASLQKAVEHQLGQGMGEAAGGRGQRIADDGGHEDPLRPEAIGHPARDR